VPSIHPRKIVSAIVERITGSDHEVLIATEVDD
jgi:hypothetical protein